MGNEKDKRVARVVSVDLAAKDTGGGGGGGGVIKKGWRDGERTNWTDRNRGQVMDNKAVTITKEKNLRERLAYPMVCVLR